jgi:hypothetical protein
MSSIAVREALRAAWPIVTPTLPYVETINTLVDPALTDARIWGTFVFESIARDPQTMGSRPWIEEQGVASVMLLSYAGVGDDEVAAAADLVVRGWTEWINGTKDIWIQSVDPPRAPDTEAVGDVYRLMVNLNYRYQTRGGS